ncbi:DNA mismatch repair protein mutS [Nannizzia gypsea CBS 118893]|uniref:DNA mismatch repair protein MSH3 n=1 Tax=Arthroderma gypseum (strain ATCC MYA-4604 / CBS 118893) TaxID=535722 RepID=E4UYE0_ARTGP|nr:DNA mismatch repair protein mutS [Nannizzia gypsea CBS 118893]EFR02103.1 DNA mismatch repair protein mutS [Nannizzia gypsea CBS 118893]
MRLLSTRGRIVRPFIYPRSSILTEKRGFLQVKAINPIVPWRGAKTKSAARLSDLVQGPLESNKPLAPFTDDVPQYPTVIQGAKYNMQKFPNCVLLTRVGNFYELYFHQAEEYASLLNLKLAYRKTAGGPVPMAGFPYFQLDRFLKILVQEMKKNVAISEEFANDAAAKAKSGGLMFDRRVARIVTPGTLIDEKFIDQYQNNYLLSIHVDPNLTSLQSSTDGQATRGQLHCLPESDIIGLSWLDLSTGDFLTQITSPQMLASAITRIGAREILVDQCIAESLRSELEALVVQEHQPITYFKRPKTIQALSEWNSSFDSPMTSEAASMFTPQEVSACHLVLEYAKTQMKETDVKLQPPRRKLVEDSMSIDRNCLRGLEILETARDGFGRGSLLHAVRRTSTSSGARLLRERLTAPSASLGVINERLDLVSLLLEDEDLRENIMRLLKRSYDTQRLVQKFSLGRGLPDDLICLSRAIHASKEIKSILEQKFPAVESKTTAGADFSSYISILPLLNRFSLHGPGELSQKIQDSIDEEMLLQKQRVEEDAAADDSALAHDVLISEGSAADLNAMPKRVKDSKGDGSKGASGPDSPSDTAWIMRPNASKILKNLHDALESLYTEKAVLTKKLQKALDTAQLSLKWTPGLGHIVHIKGTKAMKKSLEDLGVTRTVSSSKSTRSFYLPSWTQLGAKLESMKQQIRVEEQHIFKGLRHAVILNLVKLRRNASVLDELDVACSFATLAKEQGMVRPIVNNGLSHKIIGGRHPTVKLGVEEQGRHFVSNDCFVGDKERILLITGPNMAGKSTFLRQNALITILAQVGSYVPAEYAEIGLVDKIFSRIGAADDLFRDQSTFMVEMLETASILKHATPRSFVIMDEVGRGTTPEDGTAVGFACLHHLHNENKARTLFATHFHALADMTADFEHLGRYCTDLKEDASGSFSFIHKLRPGVNRQSHALKVAHLAGLPQSVIDVAKDVIQKMPAMETELGHQVEEDYRKAAHSSS